MVNNCTERFIEERLKDYNRSLMAATERVAAVLIPVVPASSECSIVFTKRLRSLNRHGGEVSFPGGLMEQGDGSLRETALRETYEEIGVEPSSVRILGVLDDQLSKWGHRVTPFVGLLENPEFTLQTTEVDRLYKVPVSHLMSDGTYYCEAWIKDGHRREGHFFRYENDIIWGLTARILYGFFCRMNSAPEI